MLKVKKVYEVFDRLYVWKEIASIHLEGWEHKEPIREWYIVIDTEDMPNLLEGIDSALYTLYKDEQGAIYELEEDN